MIGIHADMIFLSTNTGYFEEAQYRYTSNASNPACIQATIFWQHGTYRLNNNGSVTLYPFGVDGRIQVQDPCAAVTNIITYYNQQVSNTALRKTKGSLKSVANLT